MADTRHAQIRYKILDNCFRNTGKRYFMKDLQEECEKVLVEIDNESDGISIRQIYEDIKFMESAEGCNISLLRLKDGKKVYYRYEDPSYSIYNMPLNEVELFRLEKALELLTKITGIQQFEWVHDLMLKLNQGFSLSANDAPIVEFDDNRDLKRRELFTQFYDAILYKKVLEIEYKPFDFKSPSKYIIHPYYLKEFNNRWYLLGLNAEIDKSDWNIAIDRVIDIKVLDHQVYIENKTIDWPHHFDDIVGVTFPYDRTVEDIELYFFGKTIHYVLTKPLHHSQKGTKVVDDILIVRFKLIINYEFESLILSFGENVKVIKPDSLRTAIEKRLRLSLKRYE